MLKFIYGVHQVLLWFLNSIFSLFLIGDYDISMLERFNKHPSFRASAILLQRCQVQGVIQTG